MAVTTRQFEHSTVWIDGEFVPYKDAKISVLSHSLHYGGAAFEGMRAYTTSTQRTALFRAEEHLTRFTDSIRVLGYKTPFSLADFLAASIKSIQVNGLKECYVRPIAFLDDCVRGLKVPDSPRATCAILVWSWGKYLGDEGQEKGIRAAISSFRRPDIASNFTSVKLSGNYLTSVLARQEATGRGFDEALLLDPQGFVAEGSGENLFVVKGERIITPPTGYILPGITRRSVIELARDLDYTVQEQNITRNELYLADEAFFTGTAVEVTPIRQVDTHIIGEGKPGPITRKLLNTFFQCVRGELPQYRRWLTEV